MINMPLRILFLVIVAAVSIPVDAGETEVPAQIPGPNSPWPQWVAADIAVTRDGTLREDLLGFFTPALRRVALLNTAALAKEAAATPDIPAPADACRIFRGPPADPIIATRSLEELATHAGLIVESELVAARQGFHWGQPGTLFLLSPRYLKGAPLPQVFFFYPQAQISTADGMICARAPGVSGPPPRIGDRVLIFFPGQPRIDYGRVVLHVAPDRELVHQVHGGRTRVPDALRSFAGDPAPIDSIRRAVVAAIDKPSRVQ